MRMTSRMMQNNAMANINVNRILQDKLTTQMATQSKIVRPSDDPLVAIRALRLRTNLSEILQYNEKNVPDAKSWLDITESSLDNMTDMITSMQTACTQASVDGLDTTDRVKILEDMKALRDEIYATGDADYAGRNVFTGYRTNVKLSFQADTKLPYSITEQLNKDVLDSFTYIETEDLGTYNIDDAINDGGTIESDIKSSKVTRIRLAYDQMDEGQVPEIKVADGSFDADGNKVYSPLQIDIGGTDTDVVIKTVSVNDDPNPYTDIENRPNEVIFIPETGELLIGENVAKEMKELKTTDEMQITYEKDTWKEGDLRPEHYFACTANPDDPANPPTLENPSKAIEHNQEYLTGSLLDVDRQIIAYDVGFNQDIRVNTLASEVFTHDIGRDMDLIIQATQDVLDLEKVVLDLETMLKNDDYNPTEKANIQIKIDAASKALELKEHQMQLSYEAGQTQMQDYLDKSNVVLTNNGSRSKQLELISNRLETQQTSFQELEADNEGIDFTLVSIQCEIAEVSYNAALIAIGKIVQNSLINFI